MTTIQNAGGGDWLDLPTQPIQHRGRRLPEGLPWAQINEEYVAAGGQVDAGVWHKGKVQIVEAGRRGSALKQNGVKPRTPREAGALRSARGRKS